MKYLSLQRSVVLLRISVALVFFLHAAVRVVHNTVPEFTQFMAGKHWPFPNVTVWVLSGYELIGSVLLALGYCVKWLSTGFILILVVGIILIHLSLGWFVGEHGTGGVEYSFILIVALVVVMAGDRER
jgi:putative oxidoreductase